MEKGALLPIRFYPATEWADYEKLKNYKGRKVLLKEHHLFFPAFQMVMPDVGRHWSVLDLTTFDAINYDTGVVTNIWNVDADTPTVRVRAGFHRNFIWNRFPFDSPGAALTDPGKYYYHISDGETDWNSEVFEICDMGTNALTEAFTDDGGWAVITPIYTAGAEEAQTDICKTGGAQAEAYTPIEVFLGEELDLYVYGRNYTPACGAADWNDPVYFEFRTEDGLVLSDRWSISSITEPLSAVFTATIGGTARLYMIVLAADTTAADVHIWVQRRYSADHIQLRYSHPINLCNIFYTFGYENVFFLDAKQVIDENAIEETVVEDDETNKYRIIGTNKKWNDFQMVSGEAMLNAMSLLRLHDNIKIIKETGEVMDVAEVIMEQSVIDFEASQIKLVYREDSCSVEACGFDACCPTIDTPIMEEVYSGVGALPAAGAGNDGDYTMVIVAGDAYRIYLSDGAAWNLDATFDVADDCVEAQQNNFSGNRFFLV